jgi:hypothetical protein
MKRFTHISGQAYRITDGVRRAKAAQVAGHLEIEAEVIDSTGISLGHADIPIDSLLSPKALIRRVTHADEARWQRVVRGTQHAVAPFPPITLQPGGGQGTRIVDVDFDFGGNP